MRWHGTLFYWAVILLSILTNILGIRFFPHIETAALILHIVYFFALLVPLVYLAPQSSAAFVFQSFENSGGWTNNGVSWCIGLITSTYALSGQTSIPPLPAAKNLKKKPIQVSTVHVTCVRACGEQPNFPFPFNVTKNRIRRRRGQERGRDRAKRHGLGADHQRCLRLRLLPRHTLQHRRPHRRAEHTNQLSHHRDLQERHPVQPCHQRHGGRLDFLHDVLHLWSHGVGVPSDLGVRQRQGPALLLLSFPRKVPTPSPRKNGQTKQDWCGK